MEWFEHPARVVQNSVKPETQDAAVGHAKQRATVRMEELPSCYASIAPARPTCATSALGMTFDIEDETNDDDNGTYLMVSAIYRIEFGDHESIDDLTSTERRTRAISATSCASARTGPNYRTPARHAAAGDRRAADGARRRRQRQRDRDRQARPDQGPVPLGPARQEGPEQLVLGARRAALGRQGLRHVRPAAGRRRGRGAVPRRRSRTGRSSSARSTTTTT